MLISNFLGSGLRITANMSLGISNRINNQGLHDMTPHQASALISGVTVSYKSSHEMMYLTDGDECVW